MTNKEFNFYLYIIFIISAILLLVYFINLYNVCLEGMQLKYTCPDKLVKTNNNYRLYTKNKYINLSSLNEYSNIIKLQQKNKMNCPILELNTHSNLNSSSLQPTKDENTQLLLDANRSTDVYNYNLYPSYDPMNLYIGLNTPLDEIDKLNIIDGKSANPMDTEWGGNAFTSKLVNSGFYNDNMGKHLDPKILLN